MSELELTTYDALMADLDQIFAPGNIEDNPGPKLVYCIRCGTEVEVAPGADCECGNIGRIAQRILRSIKDA